MWQNSKTNSITQNVSTQKVKMWQNSTNQIVKKLNTVNGFQLILKHASTEFLPSLVGFLNHGRLLKLQTTAVYCLYELPMPLTE